MKQHVSIYVLDDMQHAGTEVGVGTLTVHHLKRYLRSFATELVELFARIETEAHRTGDACRVKLRLALPATMLAVDAEAESLSAALSTSFTELERRLERHTSHRLTLKSWCRNERGENLRCLKAAVAVAAPNQCGRFRNQENTLLGSLRPTARSEYTYRQARGSQEVEASNKELLLLNERLHIVISELNGKLESLTRANIVLQYLSSTADARVLLGRYLLIRCFTPATQDVFDILPSECGRPLTDLYSPLNLAGMDEDIASVFAGHDVIERRVDRKDDAAHYLVRFTPFRNGDQRTEGVVVTFVNVTDLTRAEARQQVFLTELQHRTRNLFAVVQSIALQTLRKGPRLDAFIARLATLGRLQGLVGEATGDHVYLLELVQLEFAAIGGNFGSKVTISGPAVRLNLESVQGGALAMHELATNAVNGGALKESQGRLAIRWRVDEDHDRNPLLVFDWRESELSSPPDASRRGYGRQLIEQALAFSLRAKTELRFNTDWISCRIEIPLIDKQRKDATKN
ncbi:two-component sensor histidine kinase [Paraburkholderia sp. BL8N3]|nr:PAS domain-containing protein [Paraburkholderia sp. BL8N3]TCK32824.1 two-component sensor histidine kinase [Paraburkholderia sp. BL8N3]